MIQISQTNQRYKKMLPNGNKVMKKAVTERNDVNVSKKIHLKIDFKFLSLPSKNYLNLKKKGEKSGNSLYCVRKH